MTHWASKLIEKKKETILVGGIVLPTTVQLDDLVLAVLEKNKEIEYADVGEQARAFRELVDECKKVKTK